MSTAPPPAPIAVLLIEDDPHYRRLCRAMLQSRSPARYALDEAGSLEEGLALAGSRPYDVCVVDYVLGEATALDFLQQARAAGVRAPVVIISAVATDDEGLLGAEWGAADYLPKARLDAASLERSIRYAMASGAALERHRLLSSAVAQSRDGVCIATVEGAHVVTVSVNPAWCRILGFAEEECLGRAPHHLDAIAYDRTLAPRVRAAIEDGDAIEMEGVARRKDGHEIAVQWHAGPIRDAHGHVTHVVFTLRDVTSQRSAELRLQQSTKMEAVGRLAGGIAHDFNNLLTAMIGYTELLLRSLHPESAEHQDAREVRFAADRAASLTRQLLAFSRMQLLEPQELDLNVVVRDMARMLRPLLGERIVLDLAPTPGLGAVRADRSQLEQVILNLVVNARDAMPTGGRLCIETQNVELSPTYARAHVSVVPGEYVMLAVTDTGVGMSAETMARAFDPFFTTKEVGQGTGLGLATVYGIVKQSGGNVWVYSEPGHGTTFKIYLPRVAATAKPPVEEVEEPVRGGVESILLVEDEPAVRRLARQVLEQEGYRVLQAEDLHDAERALERFGGPVDLLLTDMVMPGGMGHELASRLRLRMPELRVVYMSGYTEHGPHVPATGAPPGPFLQKPFLPGALARVVRQALDAVAV